MRRPLVIRSTRPDQAATDCRTPAARPCAGGRDPAAWRAAPCGGCRRERPSITRVADYRCSKLDHVQPNLMGPPRLQPAGDQRRPVAEPFPDLHVRDRAPPAHQADRSPSRPTGNAARHQRPDTPAPGRGREIGATARGSRPPFSRTRPARWSRDRSGERRTRARRRAAVRGDRPGCCGRSPAWARSAGRTACRPDDVVVFEHDREGRQLALVLAARRPSGPSVARASAPPMTATTSSPACIGRPAILTRRPSTNTPPMSSSTRACRRDRPSTRAAST